MNSFKSFHPIVNFAYFICVIGFAMFFMHPVCLMISMAGGILYAIKLTGRKAVRFSTFYMLPLLIIAALFNPLFNHQGATILTYLSSGNPLTLESIIYGVAAGAMIVTVMIWFSCYNQIMTSDKFIYLFGRLIPSLSLILSMVLRFVPKFKAQLKVIIHAQKCIGKDLSSGSLLQRIKHGLYILSILITWALEDAVQTADSMKSRGYGLKGRTAFSIYRWSKKDSITLLSILIMSGYVLWGYLSDHIYFRYYPTLHGEKMSMIHISFFTIYIILCNLPLIIEIGEVHAWKAS